MSKTLSVLYLFSMIPINNYEDKRTDCNSHYHTVGTQGCGIAMPDLSDSYIEPAGQVDFPD